MNWDNLIKYRMYKKEQLITALFLYNSINQHK